jgi:hypothetical protein
MLPLSTPAGGNATGEKRGIPRKPATKFANLRKKMEKSKLRKAGKQSRHAGR